MNELIPINILIGDRNYRIKVAPQHEEHVRKTIKTINEKILEFRSAFAGKDMQDYISMVLIWYATEVTAGNKSGTEAVDLAVHEAALQKLELQIDQLLQQG